VIGFRRVRFKFQGGDDLGEEKPVAQFSVDEVGVFADEPEAGALSEVAFQKWAGIDVPQ
jgi:hypothetical protein